MSEQSHSLLIILINLMGSNMFRTKGLTLVEMMISVAIVAILVTVVAPNVSSILEQNRVTGDINGVSAAARFARFTAVDEQTDVTLCPSSNYTTCVSDWAQAKMVFIDANGNGQRDNAERLLTTADPASASNRISGVSGALLFSSTGSVSNEATVVICPQSGAVQYASALIVTLYGRITMAVDSNNDGIKENAAGEAISCS